MNSKFLPFVCFFLSALTGFIQVHAEQSSIPHGRREPAKSAKNIPLRQALTTLQERFRVSIICKEDLLEGKTVATVNQVKSVQNALELWLPKLQLTYEQLRSDLFIITPLTRPGAVKIANVPSILKTPEDSLITGTVTDDAGRPLQGVSVSLKGTSTGTITDMAGRFRLKINLSKGFVLKFSFIGFISRDVDATAGEPLQIALTGDAQSMGEIVVTALGQERQKRNIGYSVQQVKGKELVKAREPNALNALVGKVSGLTVGASSEMLGRPQLVLRGESDVLLVVDGVPVVSDSWNLSPDDIESYSVLKGPNAAALYGSRGRNGAIVITTRKGTKSKRGFEVEFNSSVMMEKGFLTLPKVQNEYGPGEYNAYKFGNDVFGQSGGYNQNDYDIWGPRFNGQLISQYDSPVDSLTGIRSQTPWTSRGVNNLQKFIQSGILSTNNISVAASSDKYDMRVSFSQTFQKGIVPTSKLSTSNINVNTGYNLSPKLRIESNINYSRQTTPNFPDVTYGPNSMIYNIIIWGGADYDINDLKNYWQPGKTGVVQRNVEYYRYNNPWLMAKEWTRGHYKTDVYGYLSLRYSIRPWLKATLRSQITGWDMLRDEKFPYGATTYGREQRMGDYREDKRSLFENNTDLLVDINKKLGTNWRLSGLVGANLRSYNFKESYATTDYLSVPLVYTFANSLNPVKVFNYTAPMKVLSGYYALDLSYKQFINLSTSGRLDKYSTFYKGYNTGFYPSASLSTVIGDYVTLPSAISFVKARISWANVKNAFTQSNIGPAWAASGIASLFRYGSTYESVYDGPLYNSNTYSLSRPYNNGTATTYSTVLASETLHPSANASWEAGLDLQFLNNRAAVDITYYQSVKGPGIVTAQWSESSGFRGGTVNGVKTEKKGWEVSLTATPLESKKGLNWNLYLNWATSVERYKSFYDGLTSINGSYIGRDARIPYLIGDRVDDLYGFKFFRSPGGEIIHNSSGLPLTDNRQAQLLGHTNPDWVWSIGNQFAYKKFTLNFQFDGRVNGVGLSYLNQILLRGGRDLTTIQGEYGDARLAEFLANPNNDPNIITPTFTGKGVVITGGTPEWDARGNLVNVDKLTFAPNTISKSLQDYINTEAGFDERFTYGKTFAKLREVTLGYQLPPSILSRIGIRQASISLVGRNLLYFSSRKDIDWDQFIGTNTNAKILQSPTLRRYGVNLNFTF